MTYATPGNVATSLRGTSSVSDTEFMQWQAWLDKVERSITRAFRRAGLDLDAQVALGEPTDEDVVDVEVAAVVRKVQNPTWGQTSQTQSRTIDDAMASITTRAENSTGDPLELLSSELAALLPTGGPGAFSIRPSHEPDPPFPWDILP